MSQPGTTNIRRRARKTYTCEARYDHDRRINIGDPYLRITIWPYHDVLGNGRTPRTIIFCDTCAAGVS